MARLSPVLPVISGKTRFQPVFVGDVAEAVRVCVTDPHLHGIFELGGPSTYSFTQLMQLMLETTGRNRYILDMPPCVAYQAARLFDWLPGSPVTRDQIHLLKRDNVVSDDAQGFAQLGMSPISIEGVISSYLVRFRRAGQYTNVND